MRLETAERFHRTKVKLSDIEDVFSEKEDKDRGEFVILRDDRGGFVQAAGEGDGPFMVEWKNAVDGAHYRRTRKRALQPGKPKKGACRQATERCDF
jgi:hypothetical protein